jgi:hypothetical protein
MGQVAASPCDDWPFARWLRRINRERWEANIIVSRRMTGCRNLHLSYKN